MGLRVRRRIKICKGLYINVGKKSTSVSFGVKGAHYTIGKNGKRTVSVGIPGTGISYTKSMKKTKSNKNPSSPKNSQSDAISSPRSNKNTFKSFLRNIFIMFIGFIFIAFFFSDLDQSSSSSIDNTTTNQDITASYSATTSETENVSNESQSISKDESFNDSITFHKNSKINWFINRYNSFANNQITKEHIESSWMNERDRIGITTTEDCSIKIYGQENRIIVEITCESPKATEESTRWFSVFDATIKAFSSNVSQDTLASIKNTILRTDSYGPNLLNSERLSLNTYYADYNNGSRNRNIRFIYDF